MPFPLLPSTNDLGELSMNIYLSELQEPLLFVSGGSWKNFHSHVPLQESLDLSLQIRLFSLQFCSLLFHTHVPEQLFFSFMSVHFTTGTVHISFSDDHSHGATQVASSLLTHICKVLESFFSFSSSVVSSVPPGLLGLTIASNPRYLFLHFSVASSHLHFPAPKFGPPSQSLRFQSLQSGGFSSQN